MKHSETLVVTVHDLSRAGTGVARDESGRVIFIPFTAPGDKVRVGILESRKNFAHGELLEVIEASSVRQTPPCPVFGRCGGCQWQHLPYSLQWSTKAGGVKQALSRVQITAPALWDEFPADKIWEYRNRVQVRGFQQEMGYFAARSHVIVPTDHCPIARPEINAVWSEVRSEGSRLEAPYKVEIEVLPDSEVRRVWNAPHGAAGFRQVHDDQNERLRQWIAQVMTPGRELLDLFGGSGNLSLPLTGKMKRIDCVDVSSPTDRSQDIPENLIFHRSAVLPWLLQRKTTHSDRSMSRSAVIDPPREGLGKSAPDIMLALETMGVDEIVAVGCDADSWAKDVAAILSRGWKLERAAVFDFFPQTPHVESVALLKYPR